MTEGEGLEYPVGGLTLGQSVKAGSGSPSTGRNLVIVGGGPMCTYAVERLAALLARGKLRSTLKITIFERTGQFGSGATHSETQAATSYLNRVASQIAFGADESNVGALHLLPRDLRPTFYEWSRSHYRKTGDERFNLRPGDVPQRALHGVVLRN